MVKSDQKIEIEEDEENNKRINELGIPKYKTNGDDMKNWLNQLAFPLDDQVEKWENFLPNLSSDESEVEREEELKEAAAGNVKERFLAKMTEFDSSDDSLESVKVNSQTGSDRFDDNLSVGISTNIEGLEEDMRAILMIYAKMEEKRKISLAGRPAWRKHFTISYCLDEDECQTTPFEGK